MFLWVLLHLLWILEDYMNFWNFLVLKRNWKDDEQWQAGTGPRLQGLSLAQRPNWTKALARLCAQSAVTTRARDWGGTVAHSLPAWRWPDDHAVFTAGSSTAWGRSQARWRRAELTRTTPHRWRGGCGFGSNVSGRRRRSGGPRQRWCGPGALGRYGGGAKQTRGDGSSPARRWLDPAWRQFFMAAMF
jgi:hypothetical protein